MGGEGLQEEAAGHSDVPQGIPCSDLAESRVVGMGTGEGTLWAAEPCLVAQAQGREKG